MCERVRHDSASAPDSPAVTSNGSSKGVFRPATERIPKMRTPGVMPGVIAVRVLSPYGVFVVVLLVVVLFAGYLRSTKLAISAVTLTLRVAA